MAAQQLVLTSPVGSPVRESITGGFNINPFYVKLDTAPHRVKNYQVLSSSSSSSSLAPKTITSPVPDAWYPTLTVVMLSVGLLFTASFFIEILFESMERRLKLAEGHIDVGRLLAYYQEGTDGYTKALNGWIRHFKSWI